MQFLALQIAKIALIRMSPGISEHDGTTSLNGRRMDAGGGRPYLAGDGPSSTRRD